MIRGSRNTSRKGGSPTRPLRRHATCADTTHATAKAGRSGTRPYAFERFLYARRALAIGAAALAVGINGSGSAQESLRPYTVVDDGIPVSLTGARGDAARGRAIVANRQVGLCLLCHTGPFPEQRLQGNLAPDLRGAGKRWSEAQLRLRIVDARRLNPDTIMPPYYRTERLERVAAAWRGKPILTAAQIEDVVAYLATLKDDP